MASSSSSSGTILSSIGVDVGVLCSFGFVLFHSLPLQNQWKCIIVLLFIWKLTLKLMHILSILKTFVVNMTESLPKGDPGSFVIPCTIGDTTMQMPLCDLGASINLMPLLLIRRLQIDEVKPTFICLQLADRSIRYPFGVVENLLVKVGSFIFPADFVILDIKEDKNPSIILGRPFLATGRALIDVQKGEVTLRVNEEEIVLNVLEALRHPDDPEGCMRIDIVEPLVEEVFETDKLEDALESSPKDTWLEIDGSAHQREKLCTPSSEEGPPKLDLKSLPPSLKYIFLGDKDTYPVIIIPP
ncbi:uncharacterized protein LOC107459426 [Arachis duranensis]|uniref:Uncharacterized protein LOC107459426 n=1 Tax=Arachis duranensis TaxID=130453 RepID=A0A6P4B349_ARADU|nr:uncharacterized protein LOC107459426 [Arachis duranensis]